MIAKTDTLYTALLAAQKAFGPVQKNAVNPAFKSRYADLSAVIEAIGDPLWANGLLWVQLVESDADGGMVLVTRVIHAATGEHLESRYPVRSVDDTNPQRVGSSLTYARRYALLALFGLAPDDDDATQASAPAQRHGQAPRPQEPAMREPKLRRVEAAARRRGLSDDDCKAIAVGWFGIEATNELTTEQADKLALFLGTASPAVLGHALEKAGRSRRPNLIEEA